MTGSNETSNFRLPDWYLLSDPVLDQCNYDELILKVLRRLDAIYPDRINLSDCISLMKRQNDFEKIWQLLEAQHLVSGPLSNCSLTLAGRRAYQKALSSSPASVQKKISSGGKLQNSESKQIVVSILREIFHSYVSRLKQR